MTGKQELLTELSKRLEELDPDGVKELTEKAVKSGIPAAEIMKEGMKRGMDAVGLKYEQGEYYLPELIVAGETMKRGLAILKPHMGAGSSTFQGKVVVGTVKGDMHDIGKNIFISLLLASGFEVHDLGVDVPAEKFVDTVREVKPDVLGMSSLLTTTRGQMKAVVDKLREAGLRDKIKVILGGTSATPEFAESIGADAFTDEAVKGLEIVRSWLSNT